MTHRLAAAILVFGFVSFSTLAWGQTTPEMVLNPWPKGQWGSTTDKLLWEEQGHMQGNSGDKAQLFWWDSIGRFRLSTTDDQAPVIAYRYVTGATDSNSPLLPDHLDKLSLAGGVYLGKVADGEVSLVGGAGWSGNNPFADANGLFGIGSIVGMASLSGLAGWPIARLGRKRSAATAISVATGSLSFGFGLMLLWPFGVRVASSFAHWLA